MTIAVINGLIRPLLESRLPDWVEPRWFLSADELMELAPLAEIGWFDSYEDGATEAASRVAAKLRWLNTIAAGVEHLPLDAFRAQGVVLTNGAGINAVTIAEYAVMSMLVVAKGYRQVIRAAERHEWLADSPGKVELLGSKALVIGAGAIGGGIAERLAPFGVEVTKVRRTPGPGELGSDDWRARLGEFDWVIITAPSTSATEHMIGESELAAMKPTATLMNFARGNLVDQPALVAALKARKIGAAWLDVVDPEPLPPEHELWTLDNAHISMHLSGRAQNMMFIRSADRFLANLDRWHCGEPLSHVVDLGAGY